MPRESSPGWVFQPLLSLYVPAAHITGTSAIVYLDALTLGFKAVVTKVTFVQSIALVGSSGSQTINVRKGAHTTGDLLAALVLLEADSGIAAVNSQAVTAAVQAEEAYLRDADTLSIEMAASGTSFSAGEGTLTVWGRVRPQAAR
jgi:hypothetical protein